MGLVVAFLIRAWQVGSHGSFSGDTLLDYWPMAETLLQGKGFVLPSSPEQLTDMRMPGMSLMIAVSLSLTGNLDCVWLTLALQDVLTAGMIGAIIARIAGWRWGAIGIWAYGLAPAAFGYVAIIGPETSTTFLLTATAWLALRTDWRHRAVAGGTLGLAAMMRPDALTFVPVLLWPMRRRNSLLAGLLGLVVTLAPWTIRNGIQLHHWSPMPSSHLTTVGAGIPLSNYMRWLSLWMWQPELVSPVVFHYPPDPRLVPQEATATATDRHLLESIYAWHQRQHPRHRVLTYREPLFQIATASDDTAFAALADHLEAKNRFRSRVVVPLLQATRPFASGRTETLVGWPPWALTIAGIVNVICLGLAIVGTCLVPWHHIWPVVLGVVARAIVVPMAHLFPDVRYTTEALPLLTVLAVLGAWQIASRLRNSPAPVRTESR
jgi:hypothetical protein